MLLFANGKIRVRKIHEQDAPLLVGWLTNPTVLAFYEGRDNPQDLDRVRTKFYRCDGVTRCIVEYENRAIGYIQFYPIDEAQKTQYGYSDSKQTIYGMDQFIGEADYWNRGIGTLMVGAVIHYLTNEKKAVRVVLDPQTWNVRAIACYKKCGFKKVKLLPRNEWHEGEWRDCWLMEYTK